MQHPVGHVATDGQRAPEPSSARKLRSTSTAWRVTASSTAPGARRSRSSRRHSTATQPCPTAGTNSSTARRSATRSARPRTSSAATAITIAPSVGHLAPVGWRCCRAVGRTSRSGRAAASWARRRTEPVATVAPRRQPGEGRPTSASAGSRRAQKAPIASASWVTDGRSLAECTATSARPSSTAYWTSLTNTPWPPMTCSGTSWRRSPVVSTMHQLESPVRWPRSARRRRPGPGSAPVGSRGWPGAARRRTAALSPGRRGRSRRRRCARPWACRRRGGDARTGRAGAWRRSPGSAPRPPRARRRRGRRAGRRSGRLARAHGLGRLVQLGDERSGLAGRDLDAKLLDLLARRSSERDRPRRTAARAPVGPVARSSRSSKVTPASSATARSTERGTAMSTSSNGAPARLYRGDVVARDDALAGRRARDHDVGHGDAAPTDRGRRPGRRPARPAQSAIGLRLHDDVAPAAGPVQRGGHAHAHLPGPDDEHVAPASDAETSVTISTAAWLIDAVPRPIAVSLRARLPAQRRTGTADRASSARHPRRGRPATPCAPDRGSRSRRARPSRARRRPRRGAARPPRRAGCRGAGAARRHSETRARTRNRGCRHRRRGRARRRRRPRCGCTSRARRPRAGCRGRQPETALPSRQGAIVSRSSTGSGPVRWLTPMTTIDMADPSLGAGAPSGTCRERPATAGRRPPPAVVRSSSGSGARRRDRPCGR